MIRLASRTRFRRVQPPGPQMKKTYAFKLSEWNYNLVAIKKLRELDELQVSSSICFVLLSLYSKKSRRHMKAPPRRAPLCGLNVLPATRRRIQLLFLSRGACCIFCQLLIPAAPWTECWKTVCGSQRQTLQRWSNTHLLGLDSLKMHKLHQ